jgi:hypothetical protein
MKPLITLLLILIFACSQERDNKIKNGDTHPAVMDTVSREKKLITEKSDVRVKKLFPVFGLTVGKSTAADLRKISSICYGRKSDLMLEYCIFQHIHFRDDDRDGIIESMLFEARVKLPEQWQKDFGFSSDASYNEWSKLFAENKFYVKVTHAPIVIDGNSKWLYAVLNAFSQSDSINIRLEFAYGNEGNHQTSSPRTLHNVQIYHWNPMHGYRTKDDEVHEENYGDATEEDIQHMEDLVEMDSLESPIQRH